jgi:opacity protein-like surface antigen
MTKRLAASSVVLWLVCAAESVAGERRTSVYFRGGWSSPSGDNRGGEFGDLCSGGSSLGVGVGRAVSSVLTLVAGLEYSRFPLNPGNGFHYSHPSRSGGITRGATAIMAGDFSLETAMRRRQRTFVPYLLSGVGVSRVSYDLYSKSVSTVPNTVDPRGYIVYAGAMDVPSQAVFAVCLGVGARVAVGGRAAFSAEWRYQYLLGSSVGRLSGGSLQNMDYSNARASVSLRL